METRRIPNSIWLPSSDLKLPLRYGNYHSVIPSSSGKSRFKTSFEVWKHPPFPTFASCSLGFKTSFEVWKQAITIETYISDSDLKLPLRYGNYDARRHASNSTHDLKLPLRYGNQNVHSLCFCIITRFKTSFEVWKLVTSSDATLNTSDLKLPLRYGNLYDCKADVFNVPI